MKKIEKIQEHTLQIHYNDFDSGYLTLRKKYLKPTMKIICIQNLAIEVLDTLKNVKTKNIKKYSLSQHRSLNVQVN